MPQPSKVIFDVVKTLEEGRGAFLSGLKGISASYVSAFLVEQLKRPFIVATPGNAEAAEVHAGLSAFLGARICMFPDRKSADAGVLGAGRVQALATLAASSGPTKENAPPPPVIIAPIRALMEACEPRGRLLDFCESLDVGMERDPGELVEKLTEGGYERRPAAQEAGEFSLRGGILDIVPPSGERAIRLEFYGDTIESIRNFDPLTQLSEETIDSFYLVPAAELEADSSSHEATLFDLLDNNACALIIDPLRMEAEAKQVMLPEDPSGEILLDSEEVMTLLTSIPYAKIGGLTLSNPPNEKLIEFRVETNEDIREEILHPSMNADGDVSEDADGPLKGLTRRIKQLRQKGLKVVITARTDVQALRLKEIFSEYNISLKSCMPTNGRFLQSLLESEPAGVDLYVSSLTHGFRFTDASLVIITEDDMFGKKVKRPKESPRGLSDPQAISPGDFVVHIDHGIGRYRGIDKLEVMGSKGEFLWLEYADNAKLYTPIHRMGLVEKYYSVGEVEPTLDDLGAVRWAKAKQKAQIDARKFAKELVDLYAVREVKKGYAFEPPDREFKEFETTFPYEETPDQVLAIEDVVKDMVNERPMDRLVCGDVGYGKTEVALRAAFKAAMEAKQVAVLVPTTILAQQHFRTFRERLEGYPFRVEMLSRFQTPSEQKRIVKDLSSGLVDIVIGTHRLLSKDIIFKDLGLLIVDEEHRFGVSHKEKIKKFKKNVDVLSMSATPIPRTLKMGLLGLRDISIIDSAPPDRQSVQTFVADFDKELIAKAIEKELARNGQVFFVHNRVRTIGRMTSLIKSLVPDAKVIQGHGQMKETELEKVMSEFVAGNHDVLVCTAIIESGLDIPRANTIIIDQAHTFGMAELYQLRGRVGRSSERAYAYLLIPPGYRLSKEAYERINALVEFTELGSGMKIAEHDLRIRGAGEILGARQSGSIARIGYELYMKMLKNSIARLKGEDAAEEEIEPEINMALDAYIPEAYVPEPTQRMLLYRRLTRASNDEALETFESELVDRYGELPPEASALMSLLSLRLALKKACVISFKQTGRIVRMTLSENTPLSREPTKLLKKVSDMPHKYKVTPESELHVVLEDHDPLSGIKEIKALLKQL